MGDNIVNAIISTVTRLSNKIDNRLVVVKDTEKYKIKYLGFYTKYNGKLTVLICLFDQIIGAAIFVKSRFQKNSALP